MATHTITEVVSSKPWEGQYGKMTDFWLRLEGVDKPVCLSQKEDTAPPTVGQQLDGELSTHPRFDDKLKFKKAQAGGGGGRGGFGKSEQERREIAMCHAQKCAVTILEVAASKGEYTPPATAGGVATQVKTIAKALYDQIQEVSKA